MELPGGERSVVANASRGLNHSRRAKVCPGKLLFTRPHHLDRTPGRARQPRRLDCCLAGMLAAVGRAGVRHDHANPLFWNPKRLGEFAAHAERSLSAGPDRQIVALPLRQRGARLERYVRDVGHGVGLSQVQRGGSEGFINVADVEAVAIS